MRYLGSPGEQGSWEEKKLGKSIFTVTRAGRGKVLHDDRKTLPIQWSSIWGTDKWIPKRWYNVT